MGGVHICYYHLSIQVIQIHIDLVDNGITLDLVVWDPVKKHRGKKMRMNRRYSAAIKMAQNRKLMPHIMSECPFFHPESQPTSF